MKRTLTLTTALIATSLFLTGCDKKGAGGGKSGIALQNIGSDTMVNLAQAWAEAYQTVKPGVSVEVLGGGSGVGIAALINGTCDIANSSRKLEKEEEEKATAKYGGKHPTEHLVGFDALAIYVHPGNPITEISVEQLGEIYKEGGKITKWSELGVTMPAGQDEIVRASRQSNSGTYHYFREAVVGKKNDFKQGSRDMNGSKEVVDLVGTTPTAIGFSGIGYKTDKVKVVKVSKKAGEPSVAPSIKTTLDKTYPIARPMFMYVPPTAKPEAEEYITWILTAPGQKIVVESGYVPLPEFAPKDAQ
ncbi:MAG: phosphate ABC transporter substrate-binding protein [Chthoniobacteraceae bacterium]